MELSGGNKLLIFVLVNKFTQNFGGVSDEKCCKQSWDISRWLHNYSWKIPGNSGDLRSGTLLFPFWSEDVQTSIIFLSITYGLGQQNFLYVYYFNWNDILCLVLKTFSLFLMHRVRTRYNRYTVYLKRMSKNLIVLFISQSAACNNIKMNKIYKFRMT